MIFLRLLTAAFLTGFAAERPPLKIGYVGGLTGVNSQPSIKSLKAMKLAVAEINRDNGILGRKVEIVEYDNKSSAAENARVFQQMLKDKVVAISGVHHSNDGILLANFTDQHRLPMFVASATHPAITKDHPFVVRVCFTDDRQGEALANLATKTLKARRVVTIVDVSNSFTDYLAKAFEARFHSLGGKVQRTFPIRAQHADFREIIAEIKKEKGIDTIFVATAAMEAGYFTTQLVSAGVTSPILGNDGWQNDNLEQVLTNLQNTAFEALFSVHWYTGLDNAKSKAFLKNFEKRFHEPVHSFDADPVLTYDATHLLAQAFNAAGTTAPEAVMTAARAITFDGITGSFRIGPSGNPKKQVHVLKISKGKLEKASAGEI